MRHRVVAFLRHQPDRDRNWRGCGGIDAPPPLGGVLVDASAQLAHRYANRSLLPLSGMSPLRSANRNDSSRDAVYSPRLV